MDDPRPFFFQAETRLDCEASVPDSIVTIDVSKGRSTTRQQSHELPLARDEKSFASTHLASEASVFFGGQGSHKGILWRVLEGGKTLSLQSISLRDGHAHGKKAARPADQDLTLRLSFSYAIRQHGISFTYVKESEAIQAFVLTTGNVLYTLHLSESLFTRAQALDGNAVEWCQTFSPSSFTFRHPHRIIVLDEDELIISLHDSGFLRLSRKRGSDGTQWAETIVNDGGWKGSIRGLLPWNGQSSVKYGSANLSLNTATALTPSPSRSHLYTVSLNHTLKVWNVDNGQVEFQCDLLDEQRKPEDAPKYQIDPSRSHLIEVVGNSLRVGDLHYLVTFSPIGAGQFKFWVARLGENDRIQLIDMFPEEVFEPQAPSSEIWTLVDFRITDFDATSKEISLLWKHNTSSCIQTLVFDLLDVARSWSRSWSEVVRDSRNDDPTPSTYLQSLEDSTSSWLRFLFNPRRLTTSVLETSLSIYEQSSNSKALSSSKDGESLQERLSQSLQTNSSVNIQEDGSVDFERLSRESSLQWLRLYRVAADLEKKRCEALSLVIDDSSRQTWLVTADGISLIRDLGDIEVLHYNHPSSLSSKAFKSLAKSRKLLQKLEHDTLQMTAILKASDSVLASVSGEFVEACEKAVQHEIFAEPLSDASARLLTFYNRCDFNNEISEEDESSLLSDLEEMDILQALKPNIISTFCDRLAKGTHASGESHMTSFSTRVYTKASEDIISFERRTLLKVLILVAFLAVQDGDRDAILPSEIYEKIYVIIIDFIRANSFLQWLSDTTVAQNVPGSSVGQTSKPGLDSDTSNTYSGHQVSLLQQLVIKPSTLPLFGSKGHQLPKVTSGASSTLRQVILEEGFRQKCFANLLRRNEVASAQDMVKYLPRSELSSYLRGRLGLILQDNKAAADLFREAAYGLSVSRPVQLSPDTVDHLITTEEAKEFHHGQARYYKHIADLYGKDKQYGFAADFAALGLQFLTRHLGPEGESLHSELLKGLFYAFLRSSQFERSYATLTRFPDAALQNEAIRPLVTTMVEQSRVDQLLRFPFLGLHAQVDDVLLQKCQNTLSIKMGPSYHKVLFSWRKSRGDYRGAAAILYEWLCRLRSAGSADVLPTYVLLITTLMAVEPAQAWLLSETPPRAEDVGPSAMLVKKGAGGGAGGPKRRLVTLEDVKKEYHRELDRLDMIENGDYPFGEAEEMEGIL